MRVKDNDEICVIYDNNAYICAFHHNNSDYYLTELYKLNNSPELNKHITLYQALIRNENFDLVIQGLAFITFSRDVKISLYTLDGVNVYVRKKFI